MMNRLFTLILVLFVLQQTQAQNCGMRYQSRWFSSVQKFENVEYSLDAPELLTATPGVETTYPLDLKMDIYMPPPTDNAQKRPVIILAHGGGFINVLFMGGTVLVGTKDNDDVQALADSLAHWGFVTASIQYRTGFDILSGTSIKRAVWRGAQDMSAAVRFFRKNATWFNIDPDRVFVGGSSAGAFCAIHSTFVDGSERIAESYQQIPITMPDLGALHSRPVVSLTGFNPFTGTNVTGNDVDSVAQGVAAYWGAIADVNMLGGNNQAPMIMFHGTNDLVVDAECAKPFSSVILVAPETCGSIEMDTTLTSLGMPHELHLAPGEGHEYWGALNGGWIPGTGPNAYFQPMIEKTALYFYNIMKLAPATINGTTQANPNIVYTYTVANPITGGTYCWEVDGGSIVSPSQTGSSIEILWWTSFAGQRAVRVRRVDAAGVASDFSQKDVNFVTPVTTTNQAQLSVYPNPAKHSINIDLQHFAAENYQVQLTDVLGRVVWQKTMLLGNGTPQQIDVSALSKGVYWLQITNHSALIGQQTLRIE